jgi:hypothetical protein
MKNKGLTYDTRVRTLHRLTHKTLVPVPLKLSSSFGFLDDHVGAPWRDLQLEHDGNYLTATKTSIELSQGKRDMAVSGFPLCSSVS